MFHEIASKFDSLDSVLNEALMKKRNDYDLSEGFDPAATYASYQLGKFKGIEALKKSGLEARCILIEVKLQGEEIEGSWSYLRGFEELAISHTGIASLFLQELTSRIPQFNLPYIWPRYQQTVDCELEGLRLSISVIGGKKFDLKNTSMNLRGESETFGPIPQSYQDRFQELMQKLIQKPTYSGYRINFEQSSLTFNFADPCHEQD